MPKLGRRNDMSYLQRGLYSRNSTQHSAPFGNSFTPPSKIKIIAGKSIYVDDDDMRYRSRPQKPITEKPNHIDPRDVLNQEKSKFTSDRQENLVTADADRQVDRTNFPAEDLYESLNVKQKLAERSIVNPYPLVPPIALPVDSDLSDRVAQDRRELASSSSLNESKRNVNHSADRTAGYPSLTDRIYSYPEYYRSLNDKTNPPFAANSTYHREQLPKSPSYHRRNHNYESKSSQNIYNIDHETLQGRNNINHNIHAPYAENSTSQKEQLQNSLSFHRRFQTNNNQNSRQLYNTEYETLQEQVHVNQNTQLSVRYNFQTTKDELCYKYLKGSEYLPRESVVFSQEDNQLLLRLIARELRDLDREKLKQAYLDVANEDKQLSGWCSVRDVTFSLAKNKIFLSPDLLRLTAAKFVSTFQPANHLNYEKLLTFIGQSLDANLDTQGYKNSHVEKMTSRKDNLNFCNSKQKITDTGRDTETVELLHMVENELKKHQYDIDIEKLMCHFQAADRNLRGTLSISQISDICYKVGVPLQQTIIDRILSRCDRNSGGQYSWTQFLTFLERVQPLRTGLPIPQSKRPLEYARHYRTPLDSWPKSPDPSFTHRIIPQSNELEVKEEDFDGRALRCSGQVSPVVQEKNAQIYSLEKRLEDMRKAYERLKYDIERPQEETEPWFQRFMKMSNAVYAQDVDNTGRISYDAMREVVRLYNKAYNLRISEAKIERAMMDNYDRGFIYIHPTLTKLGLERDV